MSRFNFSSKYHGDNHYTDMTQLWTVTFATWLWTIIAPIILVMGTFADVSTVLVLRRMRPCPSNWFLRGMAFSDLCLLYSGLFPLWIKAVFRTTLYNLHSLICKLNIFISYSSGVVYSWLTVALVVQQALYVLWPRRGHILCQRTKCCLFILGTVGFVMLLHSHILYGFQVTSSSKHQSSECTVVKEGYSWFMTAVWNWVDLICFYLLPFTLLLISNQILKWKLIASQSQMSAYHRRRSLMIAVTATAVSMTFLSFSLPVSLFVFVAPYVYESRRNDVEFIASMELIHCLVKLLWFLTSSVICFIYYATNDAFECQMKNLLFYGQCVLFKQRRVYRAVPARPNFRNGRRRLAAG